MNAFKGYHPIVNFIYFAVVIAYAMFLMHPLCLAVSLVCALACMAAMNGRRAVRFSLVALLPLAVLTALINPAFNHRGVTILCYLPTGNPLTLESILYGLAAAAMLATVVCWFSCFHAVMTGDKLMCLFGRLVPALSLVFSMALRFVPRFNAQLRTVVRAQNGVGMGVSDGSVAARARNGVTAVSAMVGWSLEQAIDTADSMRSRGFGLPGRTAFAAISFDRRDAAALGAIVLCGSYVLAGYLTGGVAFRYFPSLKGAALSPWLISVIAVYALLCLIPVLMQIQEDLKWKAINASN